MGNVTSLDVALSERNERVPFRTLPAPPDLLLCQFSSCTVLRHGILVLNITSSAYCRLKACGITAENVRKVECKYRL
jgi:hypothetical protein